MARRGSNPPESSPAGPRDQRRDPADLLEICPAVFRGLSRAEIADRLAFYRLRAAPDPFDGLEEVLSETGPRRPVEEVGLPDALRQLISALRAECERTGRQVVAEIVEERVRQILDAVAQGSTEGEQRAALLLRHPFALGNLPSGPSDDGLSHTAPDARKLAKMTLDPLRAIRTQREVRELTEVFQEMIPRKPDRERRKDELFSQLRERFPELNRHLASAEDVIDLDPSRAARIVWGARQDPAISASQVDNRLAMAGRVLLFWESPGEYLRRYGGDPPSS